MSFSRSLISSLPRAAQSSSRAFSSSLPRHIPSIYSTLGSKEKIKSKLKELGITPISIKPRRASGFDVEIAKGDVETALRNEIGTPLATYTTIVYGIDLEQYPGFKFNDFLRQVYAQTGSVAANVSKGPTPFKVPTSMLVRWASDGDVEKLLKTKMLGGTQIEIASRDLPLSLDDLDKDLNWMKEFLNQGQDNIQFAEYPQAPSS